MIKLQISIEAVLIHVEISILIRLAITIQSKVHVNPRWVLQKSLYIRILMFHSRKPIGNSVCCSYISQYLFVHLPSAFRFCQKIMEEMLIKATIENVEIYIELKFLFTQLSSISFLLSSLSFYTSEFISLLLL